MTRAQLLSTVLHMSQPTVPPAAPPAAAAPARTAVRGPQRINEYFGRFGDNVRAAWGQATAPGKADPLGGLMTMLKQHPGLGAGLLGFILTALMSDKGRWGKAAGAAALTGGLGLGAKWLWDRRNQAGPALGQAVGQAAAQAAPGVGQLAITASQQATKAALDEALSRPETRQALAAVNDARTGRIGYQQPAGAMRAVTGRLRSLEGQIPKFGVKGWSIAPGAAMLARAIREGFGTSADVLDAAGVETDLRPSEPVRKSEVASGQLYPREFDVPNSRR